MATKNKTESNLGCDMKYEIYEFIGSFYTETVWRKSPHEILELLIEKFGNGKNENDLLDTMVTTHEYTAEMRSEWYDICHLCADCENFLGQYDNLPSLCGISFCKAKTGERICTGKIPITDNTPIDDLLNQPHTIENRVKLYKAITGKFGVK